MFYFPMIITLRATAGYVKFLEAAASSFRARGVGLVEEGIEACCGLVAAIAPYKMRRTAQRSRTD